MFLNGGRESVAIMANGLLLRILNLNFFIPILLHFRPLEPGFGLNNNWVLHGGSHRSSNPFREFGGFASGAQNDSPLVQNGADGVLALHFAFVPFTCSILFSVSLLQRQLRFSLQLRVLESESSDFSVDFSEFCREQGFLLWDEFDLNQDFKLFG